MTMTLTGMNPCGYCLGDIPAMADAIGLNSLTINAPGGQFYWTPGMGSLGTGTLTMSERIISWTIGTGAHCSGGRSSNAAWSDVERLLYNVDRESGSVLIMDRSPERNIRRNFSIIMQNSHYVLTIGEDTDDGYEVRSFRNKAADDVIIEIMGEFWSKKEICENFSVVLMVAREFFDMGDISEETLT